jgi:hypothetical protein
MERLLEARCPMVAKRKRSSFASEEHHQAHVQAAQHPEELVPLELEEVALVAPLLRHKVCDNFSHSSHPVKILLLVLASG